MAVLGRLILGSAERLDTPDFLSIDSYIASDFKYLFKSLIGSERPYILKGFEVTDPADAIGTESLSIEIADSVVYCPESNAGSFYYGLSDADALVPELRKNATNYVYLTLTTTDGAQDSRAFWDPDQNGGVGGEFTQDVNTESVLTVEVNVSISGFPADTIPICKAVVGATVISSIQDCREMMFRLGTGGTSPDPFANYEFRELPSSSYSRAEPSTTISSSAGVNPFQGGDKNIQTLKEWMDVAMTRIKEISGETYWYKTSGSSPSINSIFQDALCTIIKSKGQWSHSSGTPGQVTWSEDLHLASVRDPRTVILRAATSTLSSDGQVAWIELVRDADVNDANTSLSWINASTTLNGSTGAFANIAKGDWVKKGSDSDDKYLRVEEFYASTNLGGGATTAALAQSVRLSGTYAGTTGSETGVYTKGEYLSADVNVTARDHADIQSAGGNFMWLAHRSDTALSLSGITPTTLSLTFSEADGTRVKVTAGGAHGLQDGDRVTVASGTYAGTHVVEVESTTVFYINSALSGTDSGIAAYYAVVTTAARSTSYSYTLETANHCFRSNEKVTIAGTSSGYDGTHTINVRSATTFQIPIGSAVVDPGAVAGEIVKLARVNVRTEFGTVRLVQGETINIGDSETENFMSYVGINSLAQSSPIYAVPVSYNTIDGHANYNADSADDLTDRIAKLTAMMADKAQDRVMKPVSASSLKTITNTTNGSAQEITFTSGSTLIVATPGSNGNATVTLPSSTPGISLTTNQIAYVTIDRNATSTPSINTANIIDYILGENDFLVAMRLSTTEVFIWDGSVVAVGSIPYNSNINDIIRQNVNLKLIEGGTWTWDLPTETLTWSATAYIQIPGLANTANQINAGSVVLNSGEVAYIDLNRYSSGTLTVSKAAIASVTPTTNRVIVARREGNDVIVGTNSMRLISGDSRSMYGENNKVNIVRVIDDSSLTITSGGASATIDGISLANGDKVLFTALSTTSQRGIYVVSGVGSSVAYTKLKCFNGLDTPYAGALVRVKESNNSKNYLYTSTNGTAWERAEQDIINRGNQDRAIQLIGGGTWSFSSPTLSWTEDAYVQVPGLTNARNTIVAGSANLPNANSVAYVTINRTAGGTSNLTVSVANMDSLTMTGDIFVIARRDGSDVTVGYGGIGGGGGGTGDFLELENRLVEQLNDSLYTYMTPCVFGRQEDTLIDVSSTGVYNSSGSYDMDSADFLMSTNLLDPEFLSTDEPFDSVQLTAFWDESAVDTEALYQLIINEDFPGNIGTGFSSNTVFASAVQSDGKIILAGGFTSFNGNTRNRIVRINSDGTEDTAFYTNLGTGFDSTILALAVQDDGKILVAGNFTALNGTTRNRLVRLNSDGTLDSSFYTNLGTAFGGNIACLAIQDDGDILVGGLFTSFNSNTRNYLVRLNSDGTEDTAFYTNLSTSFGSNVRALAIQADGDILVGGDFTTFKGNTRNRLVRLNSDGTEDTSFYTNLGTAFGSNVYTIAVQDSEYILVGGAFTTFNGNTRNRMVRLNLSGTEDTAFYTNMGAAFDNDVYIIYLTGGIIFVGGVFANFNSASRKKLVRLQASGTEDPDFNTNLGSGFSSGVGTDLRTISELSNSTLIIGGAFTTFNGDTRNRVLKLRQDGTEVQQLTELVSMTQVGDDTFTGTITVADSWDLLQVSILATQNDVKLKGFGAFYKIDSSSIQGISDAYAQLIDGNFLGSTDSSLDRSVAGRGIFLRRPDGTLREISIDNTDNIVVSPT